MRKLPKFYVPPVFFFIGTDSVFVEIPVFSGPLRPRQITETAFQRHKQREIGILSLFKELFPLGRRSVESQKGTSQNVYPQAEQFFVIHPPRIGFPIEKSVFFFFEKPVFLQKIQIDEIIIERLGRARLIGTVAVIRRQQRQYLPYFHTRIRQSVQKPIRSPAQSSDPVGPGKR